MLFPILLSIMWGVFTDKLEVYLIQDMVLLHRHTISAVANKKRKLLKCMFTQHLLNKGVLITLLKGHFSPRAHREGYSRGWLPSRQQAFAISFFVLPLGCVCVLSRLVYFVYFVKIGCIGNFSAAKTICMKSRGSTHLVALSCEDQPVAHKK